MHKGSAKAACATVSNAIYFIDRTFTTSLHPLSLIRAPHIIRKAAQLEYSLAVLHTRGNSIGNYNNNKRVESVAPFCDVCRHILMYFISFSADSISDWWTKFISENRADIQSGHTNTITIGHIN